MNEDLHLTITTVGDKETAIELAKKLITRKLAACVQMDTIESLYIWEGELMQDKEIRLMIKHSPKLENDIRKCIAEIHPYDTPEILTIKGRINRKYGNWVESISN